MSFHRTFNLWLAEVYGTSGASQIDANTIIGLSIIAAYQGQGRPALPYITTNVTDRVILSQQPRDVILGDVDGTPTYTTIHDVEWRVTVQAHGGEPLAILSRLSGIKHLPGAQKALEPYRLHEVGRATFVPEMIGTKWEPRASVRLICHGIHRETRFGEPTAATVPAINIEA